MTDPWDWYIYYTPWEPTTFIFRGITIGGVKPSFFMVLGSHGIYHKKFNHSCIGKSFHTWILLDGTKQNSPNKFHRDLRRFPGWSAQKFLDDW